MIKDHPFMRLAGRLLALLIVLALSAPISAEADFSDYEPSSLKEIGDMVKKLGLEHEGGLEFYTSKYVVRVRLSGYPTEIGKHASSVLDLMWRSFGLKPEYLNMYKHELVVEAEGHSFTLVFQEALIPYLKEEAKPGDNIDLFVLLGVYDIDSGRITVLVNEFSPLTEAAKYLDEGTALYYKGDYEKALQAYEKTIELDPDYAGAWYNKGVSLVKLDRHKESLKAFEKVLELDPDNAGAWYNKGVSLVNLGRYKESLKALEKALKLSPESTVALSYKGIALAKLGRYEQALAAYDRVLKLNPDDASAWYNKACAYALSGDKGKALESLSTAIGMNNQYRDEAKKDEDLKSLWEDKDFKKLVK
jgi:tetratricopeptide (TPR) repeat protein